MPFKTGRIVKFEPKNKNKINLQYKNFIFLNSPFCVRRKQHKSNQHSTKFQSYSSTKFHTACGRLNTNINIHYSQISNISGILSVTNQRFTRYPILFITPTHSDPKPGQTSSSPICGTVSNSERKNNPTNPYSTVPFGAFCPKTREYLMRVVSIRLTRMPLALHNFALTK